MTPESRGGVDESASVAQRLISAFGYEDKVFSQDDDSVIFRREDEEDTSMGEIAGLLANAEDEVLDLFLSLKSIGVDMGRLGGLTITSPVDFLEAHKDVEGLIDRLDAYVRPQLAEGIDEFFKLFAKREMLYLRDGLDEGILFRRLCPDYSYGLPRNERCERFEVDLRKYAGLLARERGEGCLGKVIGRSNIQPQQEDVAKFYRYKDGGFDMTCDPSDGVGALAFSDRRYESVKSALKALSVIRKIVDALRYHCEFISALSQKSSSDAYLMM